MRVLFLWTARAASSRVGRVTRSAWKRVDHGQLAPAEQVDALVGEPDRPVLDDPSTPVGAREVEDRLHRSAVLERAEQPLAASVARLRGNEDPPGNPAKPARWEVHQPARGIVTIDEHLVLTQARCGHVVGLPPVLLKTHPGVAVAVDVPGRVAQACQLVLGPYLGAGVPPAEGGLDLGRVLACLAVEGGDRRTDEGREDGVVSGET